MPFSTGQVGMFWKLKHHISEVPDDSQLSRFIYFNRRRHVCLDGSLLRAHYMSTSLCPTVSGSGLCINPFWSQLVSRLQQNLIRCWSGQPRESEVQISDSADRRSEVRQGYTQRASVVYGSWCTGGEQQVQYRKVLQFIFCKTSQRLLYRLMRRNLPKSNTSKVQSNSF